MKQERLFRLIQYLLLNGKTSAQTLADELEVSQRTIYRDVDSLILSNVPILSAKGKNGGISLDRTYVIDRDYLSDSEQESLLDSLYGFKTITGGEDVLLEKLSSLFNKQAVDWLDVDFSRWGSSKDSSKFTLIKNAILESKELSFDYLSSSSKQSEKSVHPIQLKYKSRDWYLIAYSVKDNALRTYRISSILNLRYSGVRFSESYSLSDGESTQTNVSNFVDLKILVKETIAFRLYDEFEEEYISREEDGNYRLKVQLPDDAWVISFLMSLGTDLLYIEPQQIKDRYKKTLMNLQKSII